jgi:pimeloyl-ACP methyl ester carboxylesterase
LINYQNIFGEEDILFPPSETVKLFKRIPGAQTITISKVAHSIHMENPDEFLECVIDFCN